MPALQFQFRLLSLEDDQVALTDASDDVRGLVVLDASGHRVGEVDDIVIDDQEQRARFLVVASGGVLGLGAHRHLVPVEAVARVSDHVRLDHSDSDVLEGEEQDPALLAAADYATVYSHYGYTPFWEPGHRSPYFHNRRW